VKDSGKACIFSLILSNRFGEKINNQNNTLLNVKGTSPRALRVGQTRDTTDSGTVAQASLWVVEPLGAEIIVHVKVEDQVLVCRVDSRVSVRPGQNVELHVDMEASHIFDKETESAVY
jgi:multiple sugar transport system ATP-binding protein